MHFKVHGQGADLFGDGMALWYARDRLQQGKSVKVLLQVRISLLGKVNITNSLWRKMGFFFAGDVFGSKDYHHGLAIFLDTYSNHNGPHNVSIQ